MNKKRKNLNVLTYTRRLPNNVARSKCEEFCNYVKSMVADYCKDSVIFIDPRHYAYFSTCYFVWTFTKQKEVPKWAPRVLNLIIRKAEDQAEMLRLKSEILKLSEMIPLEVENNG